MGRYALVAVGIFCSVLAWSSDDILTLPNESHVLPNGLRVYMVQYPSPGVLAYQIPVRVGSRNEVEVGKTGFAHFFEHLMFRGTRNRTGEELNNLFVRMGAQKNAWTWFDMTNYHTVVASKFSGNLLEAEADRFMNLSFDEKALRDEAGAVLGEYHKTASQPDYDLYQKVLETVFQTHPYGHSTLGYQADILQYPERYDDVWPFFRRYYRPDNASIVLVGDFDFTEMFALVQREFGPWQPAGDEPPLVPQEPEQTETRTAEVVLDKPTQTRMTIAYRVPGFSTQNRDVMALQLLAEMYFSETSAFQKEFRFDKKWVDGVDAAPMDSIDSRYWHVYLRLSEAGKPHLAELRAAVEGVIAQISAVPPDAKRLAATQERFKNQVLTQWFGSPDALADQIAWYTVFEKDLEVVNRYFRRLLEVTPEDLQAFASQYLTDERKTVVTLRGSGA